MSKPRKKKRSPKRVLALPDLQPVESRRPEQPFVRKRSA